MSKDSKETELHFIKHYKKSMDKNPANIERVFHCLQRLEKLRMNVSLLEQTGIGKTVANARKLDGEAGTLARKLLHKWKEIVAKHESSNVKKVSSKLSASQSSEVSSGTDDAAGFKSPATSNGGGKSSEEVEKKLSKSSKRRSSSSPSPSATKNSHNHTKHTHHSSSSSKEKTKTHTESKSSSSSHHQHKSSHHHHKNHSSSSHKNGESLKRKCDETSKSTESKDSLKEEKTHKKPKNDTETHRERPSSSSSSKHRNKDSDSSKKKAKEVKQEGYDGTEGVGFAEALAMFDMPSTSKSKKKENPMMADKIVITKTTSSSKSPSKSDKKKSSDKPSTSKFNELKAPPKLLLEKPSRLEPLPDIVKEIPTEMSIPEYRPTPLSSAVKDYINSSIIGSNSTSVSRHLKPINDAEFMTDSMSFASKVNRTRVFSGNRQTRTVPAITSLFDMCVKVLQDHLDDIQETGGVPFDIMKPILEKARPEQLELIEYYNPYLIDESDILWEAHVKKKFRARKREDMETWREMFERCEKEDEEKLNRLTKNIKKSQEKATSEVQKTRLAFVDSMVKPPRSVMRKQEIYGTNSKLVSSPAARTDGLKHLAPNIVVAGDVRLRVAAGIRDDAQIGRAKPMIKRAPLMAKILSKMKR